jgi:hypothetical protein
LVLSRPLVDTVRAVPLGFLKGFVKLNGSLAAVLAVADRRPKRSARKPARSLNLRFARVTRKLMFIV